MNSTVNSIVRNAKITSTFLGTERGIMTCTLQLDYGDSGQAFGGWALDTPRKGPSGGFVKREGTAFGMEFIMQILETLEVDSWEKLPGSYCRADIKDDSVRAIGHITKNKWFLVGKLCDAFAAKEEK